jgi:hypothetical protein
MRNGSPMIVEASIASGAADQALGDAEALAILFQVVAIEVPAGMST